jgi:hypothetical protein
MRVRQGKSKWSKKIMKASIAYDLEKYLVLTGIPRGPKSKVYCVDPINGSDSNVGTSWKAPLKTLLAAEDKCVGNQHDTVLFISGANADNPTAAIGWDKSYTHLIGLSSDVYGVGQRCRVVALNATALTVPITFSGNGCIIKNMQFNNELSTGASGCAIVSGSRNYFENCFFMTPSSPTAASYALKVEGGSENVFLRCTIGQFTNPRSNASYSLWITGSSLRNKFVKCEFLCWSTVTTHVLVKIATDVTSEGFVTQFEDCLFDNLNGGNALAHAIVDGATETHHQIVLRGKNEFIGCTQVVDVATYTWSTEPAPAGVGAHIALDNLTT